MFVPHTEVLKRERSVSTVFVVLNAENAYLASKENACLSRKIFEV